jgi:hypothetical protein
MVLKSSIMCVLFIVMLIGCSQNQIDQKELCKEFYQLNQNKDFEEFFDLAIGCKRIRSVYDKSSNAYDMVFNDICIFDADSDEYITVPVFDREASQSEKDSVFRSSSNEVVNFFTRRFDQANMDTLSKMYVNYIDLIYDKYYALELPDNLGFKNIVLEGNPRVGKFITFTLNQRCKVYYLADPKSLTDYWRKYLDQLEQLDENWYYEIAPEK